MPERVLITGGAGFIGHALAAALVESGREVWILDDFSRGTRDATFRSLASRVHVIEHDLSLPMDKIAPAVAFDTVFHLAAKLGVSYVQSRPYTTLRDNLTGVMHVLEWAKKRRTRTVCFASTSEVYAESVRTRIASVPTSEAALLVCADSATARSSYMVSKLAGEHLVQHCAREHDMRALTFRFHNVYGPRMGYSHAIPHFIVRAIDRSDPFLVHGLQSRAFCFIDDAVSGVLGVLEKTTEAPPVINIGNDHEEIRTDDLAIRICGLAGYAPRLDIRRAPEGSPERRVPGLARLRALTGFEPRVSLSEGLARTFDWYRRMYEAGVKNEHHAAGS